MSAMNISPRMPTASGRQPWPTRSFMLVRCTERNANKAAIVDLDAETAISFGALDRITTDIAAFLKIHGVRKGSRVLLLSDECLEKLLLWFGIWRIGAVVCPLNIEINEKVLASLAPAVNPALVLLSQGPRCRCADGRLQGAALTVRRLAADRRGGHETPFGRAADFTSPQRGEVGMAAPAAIPGEGASGELGWRSRSGSPSPGSRQGAIRTSPPGRGEEGRLLSAERQGRSNNAR